MSPTDLSQRFQPARGLPFAGGPLFRLVRGKSRMYGGNVRSPVVWKVTAVWAAEVSAISSFSVCGLQQKEVRFFEHHEPAF